MNAAEMLIISNLTATGNSVCRAGKTFQKAGDRKNGKSGRQRFSGRVLRRI